MFLVYAFKLALEKQVYVLYWSKSRIQSNAVIDSTLEAAKKHAYMRLRATRDQKTQRKLMGGHDAGNGKQDDRLFITAFTFIKAIYHHKERQPSGNAR
jgi:hypothetical protein